MITAREPLCSGADCLIVGSAPTLSIPEGDFGCILGANGGAAIASQQGMEVNILATTTYLFRPRPSDPDLATLETMRGLSVEKVWADEKGGPKTIAWDGCERYAIHFQRMEGVSNTNRSEVVREATGLALWVSTGVWSACLAIASGANTVTICGISLKPGHYDQPGELSHRFHADEDAHCLRALRSCGVRMEGLAA